MKEEALKFLEQLKKDKSHDVIEFRLLYYKKTYKYIEFQCPIIAQELKDLKENYYKNKHTQRIK